MCRIQDKINQDVMTKDGKLITVDVKIVTLNQRLMKGRVYLKGRLYRVYKDISDSVWDIDHEGSTTISS